MKKEIIKNALFLVAVLVYNLLFWQARMGINVLIFTILMTAALFYLHQQSKESMIARLMALGTMVAAIGVVVFNSAWSKVVYTLSFATMVGFVQQRELKFLWYGLVMYVGSIFTFPKQWVEQISPKGTLRWVGQTWRLARLSVLPLGVALFFFGMYRLSNSQFDSAMGDFMNALERYLEHLMQYFTFSGVLFFISSVFVVGGMVWKMNADGLINLQMKHRETLQRKRKQRHLFFSSPMTALKNEYRSALMLMVLLNVLAFVVNVVDIQNIWLGYQKVNPQALYSDVHYGTYVLIFTILTAIAVLMFYFRGNLNFYTKNKWLKTTAYAWLVQNGFIAISVALRNIKYIEYYGLTYKRIGVFIFLTLVLGGVVFMILKIRDQKTAYYLFQRNAWSFYLLMVLLTTVNWDAWIARYNLHQLPENRHDYHYLLSLSDATIPILEVHFQKKQTETGQTMLLLEEKLERKKEKFIAAQEAASWRSWNYSNHRTLSYLKGQYLAD